MLRGRTSIELTRNCNIQCVPEGVAPDEIVGDQVPGATRTLVLEVTAPPLTTCVSLGLLSACMLPNAAEPPPTARKNSPAYCVVISVHSTESHILDGSGWPCS